MRLVTDIGLTSAPSRPRSGWSPAKLFAAGAVGVWYDPCDISTLFKDVAMTQPVTTDGDLVAAIADKSGGGRHATQPTTSARPTYRTEAGAQWLDWDGVDDTMAVALDLSAIDKVAACCGLQKSEDGATRVVYAHNGGSNPSFSLRAPGSSTAYDLRPIYRGGAGTVSLVMAPHVAPMRAVVTLLADKAAPLLIGRVNGVEANSAANPGAGNFADAGLSIGSLGASSFHKGRIYGFILIAGQMAVSETAQLEGWMDRKLGMTP